MNLIEVQNLEKHFTSIKGVKKTVFKNLNFALKEGEFLSILGPSGCGKSTLLRILADLEIASEGKVQWSKQNLKSSFVFQDPRLIPWKSVSENVLLANDLQNQNLQRSDLDKALNLTNLTNAKELYPQELSGGMKMRTSLARALATLPTVLWMDEPFSALDENTRHKLQEDLNNIYVTQKSSIVFVTHSISEAVLLSQRILIMNANGELKKDIKILLPEKRDSQVRISNEYLKLVQEITLLFKEVVRE